MTFFEKIRDIVEGLDARQFKIYAAVLAGVLVVVLGFITYRYYSSVSTLKKRLMALNEQKEEVKTLLERYKLVQAQRESVDKLLKQDPNFKILNEFNSLMSKLDLTKNKGQEPTLSSSELENGYTEITLFAYFTNITMQKLTEFLDALEKNERIYTKELEIWKPNQAAALINANVQIATLLESTKARAEAVE